MHKRITMLLGAAAMLGVSCGSSGTAKPTAASPQPSVASSTSAAAAASKATILSEDFVDDRNDWGVVDDPHDGSISYSNGDYVWAFKGSVAHWLSAALDEQFQAGKISLANVAIHTDATVTKGDGVIGLFCRDNPDTDAEAQWYEFVARDGYAAIRLADQEGNITPLAEDRTIVMPNNQAAGIDVVCADESSGGVRLSMSVNDKQILETTVTDHPLHDGLAGLQAWTHPVHDEMDILWHDFTISPVS